MYTKMAAARFLQPSMGEMTINEICDMLEYPAAAAMVTLASSLLLGYILKSEENK